jgi:hypothetical protein
MPWILPGEGGVAEMEVPPRGLLPTDFDVLDRNRSLPNFRAINEADRDTIKGLRANLLEYAKCLTIDLHANTRLQPFSSHPAPNGLDDEAKLSHTASRLQFRFLGVGEPPHSMAKPTPSQPALSGSVPAREPTAMLGAVQPATPVRPPSVSFESGGKKLGP